MESLGGGGVGRPSLLSFIPLYLFPLEFSLFFRAPFNACFIGLLGICIAVNTMNIWMDIYDVILVLASKLRKILTHMAPNWTLILDLN